MDVDDNNSCKKTKILSQDDQVSSEIVAEELKKIVLFPKKSVQLNHFSFGGEDSTEPSSAFKSKAEFMTSYAEKQMQSLEETKNLLPQVRSLGTPKSIIDFYSGYREEHLKIRYGK